MSDWLQIPEIAENQASKYLTHNQAIRKLRILSQIAVKDKDLTAPPGSPADGDCYIVGGSATGAWAGHDGDLAFYSTSSWVFLDPVEGWLAYAQDEDDLYVFNGSSWVSLGTGESGDPVEFGINWNYPSDTKPAANVVLSYDALFAFSLPEDLAGSIFKCATNPAAEATITLKKNADSIGTLAIQTDGTVTVTFSSDMSFAATDTLSATFPAQDATLAGVRLGFLATRA